MRRRRRIDRDRPHLDPVCSVDVERAVDADDRPGELAVSTPDDQIARGLCDRQTRTASRPSADRERTFSGAGETTVTAHHGNAREEQQHEPPPCWAVHFVTPNVNTVFER